MNLIIITSENLLPKEASAINRLFEHGLKTLHLRKPYASLSETKKLIEEIDANYHQRIVLHDYFSLTGWFDLKGIHLNKRNPDIYPKPGLTISKSCHSLDEITQVHEYDYVFLSPVFDSISKTGYLQGFTAEQLREAEAAGIINERIVALGGITSGNIPEVKQYGFGGIAVLGALWKDFEKDSNIDNLLKRFNILKATCEKQ